MKLVDISTTKYPNTFAMVDDEDFDFISQWRWRVGVRSYGQIYAVRYAQDPKSFRYRGVRMHREILRVGAGYMVDHIDGNPLNNQKTNLRPATNAENSRNRKRHSNNKSSKYKGVRLLPDGRYRAIITSNRKRFWGGDFVVETDAAVAYNQLAEKHHREFARLNTISKGQ